jgi:hypothetical protein
MTSAGGDDSNRVADAAALDEAGSAVDELKQSMSPPPPPSMVGPLATINGYLPRSDRSHLRLGITLEGMYRFLEEVGLIEWEVSRYASKSYHGSLGWKYVQTSYQRREKLQWIEDSGTADPVKQDPHHGLANMTGYDICDFLRQWLKREGFGELSVCEVILTSERFGHLRHHCNLATIFWSHIQREPCVAGLPNSGTLSYIYEASIKQLGIDPFEEDAGFAGLFFWVDYFSLRQATSAPGGDFKTEAVVDLIKDMGALVACIDPSMHYATRTFCVLELYAAVAGGVRLVCHTADGDRAKTEGRLLEKPPNTAAASTRNSADKNLIDEYIISSIGFAALDELVARTIIAGGVCKKHLRVRCPDCYPGESASPSGGYDGQCGSVGGHGRQCGSVHSQARVGEEAVEAEEATGATYKRDLLFHTGECPF